MTTNPEMAAIRMPQSVRYRLTADEAAAALQVAGMAADGTLLAPRPPVAAPDSELARSGVLGPDGGLPPFLRSALAVAATPGRVIHVVATVPGAPGWVDLQVGAAAGSGPFVSVDEIDGGVDLRALESAVELAAVLDDLFRCTSYPTRPVDPDIGLPLPAWLGLLAASDVRQEARLRAAVERRRGVDQPLTDDALERAVAEGLRSTDTRWAVACAVPTAPVSLRTGPRPGGAEMADALNAVGLVSGVDGGWTLTELGEHLVTLVEQTIIMGSLTLTYRRPGRAVRGGEILIYRTPTRLGVGVWSGVAQSPVLTLIEPTNEAAVGMLRRLCELPDRHPVPSGPAPAPPAEPVPATSAAPSPPWTPTHTVREGGVHARTAPQPSLQPVAALPPGLAVEVRERRGDWALVRTEQGWEAWVDGRRLVPR